MELFLLVDIVNKVNKLTEGDIEIGTVETVGSGESAYATLDGIYPNWILNLGIPRGLQGDTGAQGIQGVKGDTGAQGIQGVKGDTGAQGLQGVKGDKGDKGDTGAQGPQGVKGDKGDTGDQGSTGPSNALEVGTVTTGAPGSDAEVTITGTSPNQTINFTIPEGNPGFTGVYGAAGTVPGPYPDGTVTFEY